jgi:hypothetical protein
MVSLAYDYTHDKAFSFVIYPKNHFTTHFFISITFINIRVQTTIKVSFYYCYMKKRLLKIALVALLIPAFESVAKAQSPKILKLDAAHPIADVQPTMWGIFFEDINFAADGGLYAELVKNRSFEFAQPMTGWKEVNKVKDAGSLLVLNRSEVSQSNNPRFVRATIKNAGNYGITNEGFRGMGITAGAVYNFSVLARMANGTAINLPQKAKK